MPVVSASVSACVCVCVCVYATVCVCVGGGGGITSLARYCSVQLQTDSLTD